ncbi:TPA: hypothetical protein U2N26_003778 [Acinetobacter nosocomialis]|uniref:hypothetical protein n=1 Tax=Acinetobacter calcoaceticus/baumannii complex TaxID=909768 RepID=UPI000452C267|nr:MULTISPECIES: hypothetical protein [Acinetobacter calcoaceticus/baumannii complex]EXB65374.1 hypothetical protein J525_3730 [Acinetobacter sp. 21871]MBJ8458841.1 hypothetical protein [Acinetobacter nosocomialis]PSD65977.1 hypothetical protein C7G80_18315 [Acinetobacter nosocomialis]HEM7380379.1 hypothetical protein [Acinetobacter nosocomialis]HEM8429367.1 hypothetical protein [Acinetobacter nosocomialis]
MTIKTYDIYNPAAGLIDFTLGELTDIYSSILWSGCSNDNQILKKIETKYTFCSTCSNLVLKEEFNDHLDKCLVY